MPHHRQGALVRRSTAPVTQKAIAHHPGGTAYLRHVDRELAAVARTRYVLSRLSQPIFLWPAAAAMTQLVSGLL